MKESNYFSWRNLSEMTEIESHIGFASSLMNKYDWDAATKQNLREQLTAITAKQNDKKLNISVIGEFSTGKSSFINALVGYELLAVNVIQGTTVAITIIEYAAVFSLTTTNFSGLSQKQTFRSVDALREQLHGYTTDPSYASKISHVTVTLPSEILKQGYRIIDTPGTNSLELWHEDITRRAIRELSDLSIILTDATRPMSETLINFVDNTLGNSVKTCAFVANKIDQIKERERQGMVRYIEKKICQSFELEEAPPVYPFSSVALTNAFSHFPVEADDDSKYLSTNSMSLLLRYTAKQRVKTQARKLLCLIDNIYSTLQTNIERVASQYRQELNLLERTKQTDLSPFLSKQISARQRRFMSQAKEYKYSMESACESFISQANKNIEQKIYECKNLGKLSQYIKGTLTSDIQNEGQNALHTTEEKFYHLHEIFKKELKTFQKEFGKEFEKMRLLSFTLNVKPQIAPIQSGAHTADISQITQFISEELSKENWTIGGGFGAGALIGTAICPGIGTFLGGVIGGFVGASVAPKDDEVKAKVVSKLSTPIRSYYSLVVSDCLTNYNNYVNTLCASLESEINRYYATYNQQVQKRMNTWNAQHQNVKERIAKTKNDIDAIRNRHNAIRNIISKL